MPYHLIIPFHFLKFHPVELLLKASLSGEFLRFFDLLFREVDYDTGENFTQQAFESGSELGSGDHPRD